MIEQRNSSAIYEQYYNQCEPIQCTYTIETGNDIVYTVTTLFGIAGGLTTVLQFLIPRLVKFIRKKNNEQRQRPAANVNNPRILLQKAKYFIQNLNFFPSVPSSIDEHEIRHQRISTRLFIFLLTLSMAILLLYNSLREVTQTVNVDAPSFDKYVELNSTYARTLTCPCSKISINDDAFLEVNYTLHQVCDSIFLAQTWIDYLANYTYISLMLITDFRRLTPFAFQALRAFCQLTNQTISDRFTRFYANQYVSASVILEQLFESETEALIRQFRSSMRTNFLLSYSIIRDTTQANALLSERLTNYHLCAYPKNSYIGFTSISYERYRCISSSKAPEQAYIYRFPHFVSKYLLPGLLKGCYIIEALLQSTLVCLYSKKCIDDLEYYTSKSSSMNIPPLNASLSTRYPKDATVQQLAENLMIEERQPSRTIRKYYNQCHPIHCTYTYETKNNVIYIVTTLFGIAGGLTTVLQFLVPRSIKFIIYCIRKHRARIVPNSS